MNHGKNFITGVRKLITGATIFFAALQVAVAADFTPAEIDLQGITDGKSIDLTWTLTNGTAPNGYRILWSLDQYPTYPLRPNDYYDTLRTASSASTKIDYFLNTGTYYVRICIFDSEDNCVKYSNQLDFQIQMTDDTSGTTGSTGSDGSADTSDGTTSGDDIITEIKLTDIEGHPNQTAIEYLYQNEVISGYPDNTFQPDRTVNRAELIKILVGGKGINPTTNQYKDCFPDVGEEWFAPYICYAKTAGWVQGYPDNNFKPSQEVNKAEAIKMLINSQGFDLPTALEEDIYFDVLTTDWFAPYVKIAKDKGLLEEIGSLFNPETEMTRAGISENIYRAMYIEDNQLEIFE